METLVIGSIIDYEYNDVAPWINSLKQTGYAGKIALIVYRGSKELIEKLEEKGVHVLAFEKTPVGGVTYQGLKNPDFSIMVERFAHMWYFLNHIEDFKSIDHVITTDVKDVIFQSDPVKEFDHPNFDILVGQEGFLYDIEPWSKANMKQAFGPFVYESMKNKPIICAGVIAGKVAIMKDLFLQIFLLCRGTNSHIPGGGGPDQAALNILFHSEPWKSRIIDIEDILHVGTSIPGIKAGNGEIGAHYKQTPEILDYYQINFLRGDKPYMNENGMIMDGQEGLPYHIPYSIVHQYNRIPEWNKVITEKYKD